MIYVPEKNADLCYIYDIPSGLLKSYSITEYNTNPLNLHVDYIYENKHYRSFTKEVPLTSISNDCLLNDNLTTDFLYRNDIIDILVLVLLLCIFIIYPTFYLLGKFNKKYFK